MINISVFKNFNPLVTIDVQKSVIKQKVVLLRKSQRFVQPFNILALTRENGEESYSNRLIKLSLNLDYNQIKLISVMMALMFLAFILSVASIGLQKSIGCVPAGLRAGVRHHKYYNRIISNFKQYGYW